MLLPRSRTPGYPQSWCGNMSWHSITLFTTSWWNIGTKTSWNGLWFASFWFEFRFIAVIYLLLILFALRCCLSWLVVSFDVSYPPVCECVWRFRATTVLTVPFQRNVPSSVWGHCCKWATAGRWRLQTWLQRFRLPLLVSCVVKRQQGIETHLVRTNFNPRTLQLKLQFVENCSWSLMMMMMILCETVSMLNWALTHNDSVTHMNTPHLQRYTGRRHRNNETHLLSHVPFVGRGFFFRYFGFLDPSEPFSPRTDVNGNGSCAATPIKGGDVGFSLQR